MLRIFFVLLLSSKDGEAQKKYLQFVALDRLLLRRLLHKVRDEDFQCGSSWNCKGK